jgi:murein L,D-transpeptidase YafK
VVQLQIFPFRMTPQKLAAYSTNPNIGFWMNIKEGYDRFELAKVPPSWDVCEKKYVFELKSEDGTPLDAAAACPARGSDPLLTALTAKQAADDAQYRIEVAALNDKQARDAAKIQAEADAKAAAKARGEAVGGFFSGVFGVGQPAPEAQTAATPTPAPSGPPKPWPARPFV